MKHQDMFGEAALADKMRKVNEAEPIESPNQDPAGSPADTLSKYVAVVYFHGMGSQRHYEELSRLVDRLDHALYELSHHPESGYDGLRLVQRVARIEKARHPNETNHKSDTVYILARSVDKYQKKPSVTLRFYEAYWAPEAVQGTNAATVTLWLVRQAWKPVEILRCPWRSFRRLRRASLVSLFDRKRERASPDEASRLRDDTAHLIGLYEDFQNLGARSKYPRGSFSQFRQFLRDRLDSAQSSEQSSKALLDLARDWNRTHLWAEWRHLLSILTIFAGGLGVLGLLVLFVIGVLSWLQGRLGVGSVGSQPLNLNLHVTPALIATVVSALISALGIRHFLEDSVGDVQQYVTYEETDKLYARRCAILESAGRQMRHVLEDPQCERVIVIAHSLGSAIAVDTLLNLWRDNRASGTADPMSGPLPISKVRHLVTLGSPVDKCNYFFAVLQSSSPTYEQLIEDLRGDIGTPPFSRVGRQPWVHWINYWDKGDVISGPIVTVCSSHMRGQEVDNVQIATYAMPDLLGSHKGYFRDTGVLRDLLDILIFDKYAYANPPRDSDGRPKFALLRRGPGRGHRAQTFLFPLVILLPWLLFLTSIEIVLHWGVFVRWTLVVVVSVLVLAIAIHRPRTPAASQTVDSPEE